MLNEDINNLKKILALCEGEINNNNENAYVTIDIAGLKSLKNLAELFEKSEELHKRLIKRYSDFCDTEKATEYALSPEEINYYTSMTVEVRGYKGDILKMEKHNIEKLYEIQLQAPNDTLIRIHNVKPEEIRRCK